MSAANSSLGAGHAARGFPLVIPAYLTLYGEPEDSSSSGGKARYVTKCTNLPWFD